jgi:hypothetical protein
MRESLAFPLLINKTAKELLMRNVIGLGALIAVFSLSYSYGGPKLNEVKKDIQERPREADCSVKRGVRGERRTCELVKEYAHAEDARE